MKEELRRVLIVVMGVGDARLEMVAAVQQLNGWQNLDNAFMLS